MDDLPELLRVEDRRLLTGGGEYLADLPVTNTCEVAILRSPHPHADIESIDVSPALAVPGVHAVVTGRDLDRLGPLLSVVREAPPYRPIAVDRVRYVGEPVALVIAQDRYCAEDGLELVDVRYRPLHAVSDVLDSDTEGAPLLHENMTSNCAWSREFSYGDVDAVFDAAEITFEHEIRFPAYTSLPLETYGIVAEYRPGEDAFVAHCNFQGPFSLHGVMAKALGIPGNRLRVIVPRDIGGSFGIKGMMYPYIVLLCAAARATGRTLRWIEDRAEHLIGSSRASDQYSRLQVACDRDGTLRGLRSEIVDNLGAYLRAPEPATVVRTISSYQGVYRMDAVQIRARSVLTNTVPTGLNRGYGGPQHFFALERLIDELAAHLSLDPIELRRRNLIDNDRKFPIRTLSGGVYDSGDYSLTLDKAVKLADLDSWRATQAEQRRRGRYLGVGLVSIVDGGTSNMGYIGAAVPPEVRDSPVYRPKSGNQETALIHIDPEGTVVVSIATAGCGQSHETVARQVAADTLGVPAREVIVRDEMDTCRSRWGIASGSYSSRFAPMTTSAVQLATQRLRAKLLTIAAHQLGAPADELDMIDGKVTASGNPTGLSLRGIAALAHWNPADLPPDVDPGLDAAATFSLPGLDPINERDEINVTGMYPFMVDIAFVEVDLETGRVTLDNYVSVHDSGRILNPHVVIGQRRGALAHGIGGALYEHLRYDHDAQPMARNLHDYLCVTAADMPPLVLADVESPSPLTPLGAKGCGDGAATPAPVAIANAVADALRPLGVSVGTLPLTGEVVWNLLRNRPRP